jgi:glycosyltransferase involved in cell wall biosynthesis
VRVLFLNPAAEMGGAENALLEVIAGLRDARPSWWIGLVAGADGPLLQRARGLGADVRLLPFPPALSRFGERSYGSGWRARAAVGLRGLQAMSPVRQYVSQLRAVMHELAPDIIHSNGLKMHVLAAWAKPSSTPLVWHLHDYVARRRLSAAILERCASRCSLAIANSRSVRDDFLTLRGTLPPVQAIWNAVDLARFSPSGARLDLDGLSGLSASSPDVVRVGLLSTFAVWKGHDVFLEAIARLPRSLDVRAYVIGGPLYATEGSEVTLLELQATAARLGVADRVGFTGFVNDSASAIRALDVVVHASTAPEPFGLAIAEGMACGRPVIVSAAGGAAEIASPGANCMAVPPGDAGALAGALESLAKDAYLRLALGTAGRSTAERSFGRARLAREIIEAYARVAPSGGLRVLHVHSGNLYGGVETFLTTLARDEGRAPEMLSSFALCFTGQLRADLTANAHPPFMLGAVRLSRPWTARRARRALTRLLAARTFDVVVCHQAWAHAIFGPVVRRAGLPLVFWMHTSGADRHWLDRMAARTAPDLIVANSQFTAGNLDGWFPGVPIEVVYYPIHVAPVAADPGAGHELRRALDTPADDVVIVQVGRLERWKGYRETIQALSRLRDLEGWTYWLVGGPQRPAEEDYFAELKALTEETGLASRVRFAGQRVDVEALLNAADIYCQPNVEPEPFGITFVEAQAASLPIVSSAAGGALELVDNDCGRLVPSGDIDATTAALRELITDRSLRVRLGQTGRQRSSMLCDVTRQIRRTHDVLTGAVIASSPIGAARARTP